MASIVAFGSGGQDLQFTEQSATAGLDFLHEPHESYPGEMQSNFVAGAAAGDFDRDGWQDVFIPSDGTNPCRLCLNDGDGTFTEVADVWNIDDVFLGAGVAVGDYDNNGFLDIYVTSFGPAGAPQIGDHRLYRNNGNGTFTEVAEQAGVATTTTVAPDGMGAAFGDYDCDGDLDLFVTSWAPGNEDGNILFRNNGDGTFTNANVEAGIAQVLADVAGFGAAFCDMDGDRDLELLIVGDHRTSEYFINNGDGTFTNFTREAGVGYELAGMGQDIADFDNDGLIDWYVTTIYWGNFIDDGNRLYINQGGNTYEEISEEAGTFDGAWGWGTVAADFDHDGWVDIAETNGWNNTWHRDQPARLWLNNTDLTFSEEAAARGFDHAGDGRGLITFDYDNDGDLDMLLTGHAEPPHLYRNDVSGSESNWLRIFLDTSSSATMPPDGYGANVRIRVGDEWRIHPLSRGTHFLSQSELSVHFGLGAAESVDEINVDWCNGDTTVLTDVAANQTLTIRPGTAAELTDVVVIEGAHVSGGLPELADSDDQYYRTQHAVTGEAAETHRLNYTVFANTTVDPVSSMAITLEGNTEDPFTIVTLFLRNHDTNQLEQVGQFSQGLTDSTETVSVPDAARFVDGSGDIELRVKKHIVLPSALGGTPSNDDQIVISVE